MGSQCLPNIVFILVDDMGYGDFGRFNGGLSQTPHLDALMDESVVLSQQYTGSPVCNPSRACLLTGRYPHRTGSIDTLEWHGLERLALREVTLADLLKQAGYRTGLVGKWHLGSFDKRYHPMRRGFDEAVCFRGGMHDYWCWRLEYGDTVKRGDGQTYMTDVWTDEAIAFLRRQNSRQPFFLHLAYNAPHTPLQCPEEDVAPFADNAELSDAVKKIYGMIRRMDCGVGRVLAELRKLALDENTIVVFSSDNGPQFGGQGDNCTTRFNCQYHGAKGTTYEGGIRVPGIVRWPAGGLSGGCEVREMVHFADWMPTLLAAAGLEPPRDRTIDGLNVLPVLQGQSKRVCDRRFWQWNRYEALVTCNAAMRDGDWKLVRPKIPEAMKTWGDHWLILSMYGPEYFEHYGVFRDMPKREIPPPPPAELYHLADDPLEQNNLAGVEADRVARMTCMLEQWFEEVEAERRTITDSVQYIPHVI